MRIGTVRPYAPTGLNVTLWSLIDPELVPYHRLTTTQDGVFIAALLLDLPRAESDGYPHVVEHDGRLYLEDGHTRVVRDLLRGHTAGWCRVLRET